MKITSLYGWIVLLKDVKMELLERPDTLSSHCSGDHGLEWSWKGDRVKLWSMKELPLVNTHSRISVKC